MPARLPILVLAAGLALGASASAQCTVSGVSFTAYGAACNPVFGPVPALAGSWTAGSCTIRLTLTGFQGCCNTFVSQRMIAIGTAPANVPLPGVGPGCSLYVVPDLFLLTVPGAQSTFDFLLPPGMPSVTVFAQGAIVYFTTIGFSYDAALSNGLQVDIN